MNVKLCKRDFEVTVYSNKVSKIKMEINTPIDEKMRISKTDENTVS